MERFTWIPFYTELAEKLLEYKDKREELVKFIFAQDGLLGYTDYLHLQDKSQKIDDIDPFSFIGIFNRGNLSPQKRIEIINRIKGKFGILADVPTNFDGIPKMNYARSFFYNWHDLASSCNAIWFAYESIMNDNLLPWFDYWEIAKRTAETTIPLFWCKPNNYIALDSRNVKYLTQKGINVNVTNEDSYRNLLQDIENKMETNEIEEKSFVEISFNAWQNINSMFSFQDFHNAVQTKLSGVDYSIQQYWIENPCFWVNSTIIDATNECHYEINADNNTKAGHTGNKIFIEVHFEDENHRRYENALGNIEGIQHFPWLKRSIGFRINDEGIDMIGDVEEVAQKAIDELCELDSLIGNKIKQIKDNMKAINDIENYKKILEHKKNIILQGAPGTGKTYNTAALALSICGEPIPESHEKVMKRYNELQEEGRIGFCTFHQSMDYEDFVEGIKPKTENGVVSYNVEDGVFKIMCANANKITTERKSGKVDFTKTRVFKMSLGEKNKDDEEIFNYCFENNVVALGWGGDKDFSNCTEWEDFKKLDETWGAKAMTIFKQWMRVGDIILVSDGTKAVKAIAKITGEYEFHNDKPIDMCQYRNVEWLYTGDLIPISKLYHKNLSQQSIYAFFDSNKEGKTDYNYIKTDVLNDIITGDVNKEKIQNHVLIIDEINRGNVSRIFGELITLLEADKRLDDKHPIKITLPYSKKTFGVPSNFYIIGTMNTTDRSTGTLDYALRRRFAFVTLKSDESIVKKHYDSLGDKELGRTAIALFCNIKEFINNPQHLCGDFDIDDLMVGHSYFMAEGRKELENKIEFEVVPLINEYINDGILKVDVEEKTKAFETWKILNTIDITNENDVADLEEETGE